MLRRLRSGAAILLLLTSLVVSACAPSTTAGSKPLVITSISPLVDLIKHVGGDRVEVRGLVPAGSDPHDFEPKPTDVAAMAKARLFIANGTGEEAYLQKLVSNAGKDLQVVTLSDGQTIIGNNPGNPHLWLDVKNAIAYVDKVQKALSQADPAGAATYRANAEAYTKELNSLDAEIRQLVQTIPPARRKMVVFHDAWPYFCQAYGLKNLPMVENPEAEVSPKVYDDLVKRIKAEGVPAVFGEAGFNPKLVQRLAADTGVKFVGDLYDDTLGDGDAASYIGMMRVNAKKIVEALK